MLALGDSVYIAGLGVIAMMVMSTVVVIAMLRRQDIKAKLGSMEITLSDTLTKVDQIHHGINDNPSGRTISQEMIEMKAMVSETHGIVQKLDERVTRLESSVGATTLVQVHQGPLDIGQPQADPATAI